MFACVNVDTSTTYSAEERIANNLYSIYAQYSSAQLTRLIFTRTHNQCTGRCHMFLWWVVVLKLSFNSTIYGLSDESAHNLQCHKSAVSCCYNGYFCMHLIITNVLATSTYIFIWILFTPLYTNVVKLALN